MGDEWIQHMYNQQQLPFHLSNHDQHNNNPSLVSDSTPPHSSGRVAKPVRKRSRASRRTPTTLLNTDAANFRAMVQQFTGGPSHNHTANSAFDPTAAAYHQPLQQPPFMFSLGNSSEAFFQEGGGLRSDNNSVVDYTGLFHGYSPAAHNPRPAS